MSTDRLPAKGTNPRRVLDVLRGVKSRTRGSIHKTLSDISNNVIDGILEAEIKKGHVTKNTSGFALTAKAKRLYEEEGAAIELQNIRAFRPMTDAHRVSSLGMRPGSNDFRNWPSRFN